MTSVRSRTQRRPITIHLVLCLLFLQAAICLAQEGGGANNIPEKTIASLQIELAELNKQKRLSLTRKRLALKRIIRKVETVLAARSKASNRYEVLALMLDLRKQMLPLDKSPTCREVFFSTCRELSKAPDEYARLRLNADMFLMEQEQNQKTASLEERAEALRKLVKSYRDTPAELRSLVLAAHIAPRFGALELKAEVVDALTKRFAGSPEAIAYRKKLAGALAIDVLFAGTFERADGVKLTFPIDRIGHPFIALFWSKDTQGFKEYLEHVKTQLAEHPGRYDVFSFNLDDLPDAGQSILKGIGLTCTAMRLPGGRSNPAYYTYAMSDPHAVIVNQFGRTSLAPQEDLDAKKRVEAGDFEKGMQKGKIDWSFRLPGVVEPNSRYLMQIQSLSVGEFLLPSKCPEKIRSCFTPHPLRYRLTPALALANYERAEKLCRDAIAKDSKAPELWRVLNCRIIALLGIWKMRGAAKYLEQAVRESKTVLAGTAPAEGQVTARFCLAKDSLRQGSLPKPVLASVAKDESASALAAACMLAIDVNKPELHEHYREQLLKAADHRPELWPVLTFLRDRLHQLYLFRSRPLIHMNAREYKWAERRHVIDNGIQRRRLPFPAIELKTLDGGKLNLPKDVQGKLLLLVFIELPAAGETDVPRGIYSPPGEPTKRRKDPRHSGFMVDTGAFGEQHVNKELDVVFAFLNDDAVRITALKKKYNWPWQVALVPGGLSNPMVRKLGILSADRNPNVFLVRRDETICWSENGLTYVSMGGHKNYVMNMGMKSQIATCEVHAGYQALEQRKFKRAVELFTGPFAYVPQKQSDPMNWRQKPKPLHRWQGSRFHGRALAHIGLGKWEEALKDVDTAIFEHSILFDHDKDRPCHAMIHMLLTKSKILDKLGRAAEARKARSRTVLKPTAYPTTYYHMRGYNRPYELFQDKLAKLAKDTEKSSK